MKGAGASAKAKKRLHQLHAVEIARGNIKWHKRHNHRDGSIIIHMGDTYFKLYRDVLTQKSPFFSYVIHEKAAEGVVQSTLDGIPVVHIKDYDMIDRSVGDFVTLLDALDDPP